MLIRATALVSATAAAASLGAAEPARDYPVKPVPFTAVHFTDSFWLPRWPRRALSRESACAPPRSAESITLAS